MNYKYPGKTNFFIRVFFILLFFISRHVWNVCINDLKNINMEFQMNKFKVFLAAILFLGMVSCIDTEPDEKEGNSSYAQLTLQADSKTITASEHEDTRGIKLYPDYEYWHINFKHQGSQLEHPIIFHLKKDLIEGEILKPGDDGVKVVFREDSGTFKTSPFNDDFTLTVEKWHDSDVQLSFSGKVWNGGVLNRTLIGKITTRIDRNQTSAYFSSFNNFDDYNEDGTISINITPYSKITLSGECNSSYGSPSRDTYKLIVPAGKYSYNFSVFNLAQGSIANLINTGSSTFISRIDNAPYNENYTVESARTVVIQQGSYWNTQGDYTLIIKKTN